MGSPIREIRYKASATPVIVGLEDIGAQFGRTRWTIRRWIEREGFPASRLPDGAWVTSLALIDRWIMDRIDGQAK